MAIPVALVCLTVTIGYGTWRLKQADRLAEEEPLLRVLLVQENQPTMFDSMTKAKLQQSWTGYLETTRSLARAHGPVDLVVWPESAFSGGSGWVSPDIPDKLSPEYEEVRSTVERNIVNATHAFELKTTLTLSAGLGQGRLDPYDGSGPHLLVGTDAHVLTETGEDIFNSALFLGPDTHLIARYDKINRVMFGEYIPLPMLLGWLGKMFGFVGIQAGDSVQAFKLAGVTIAPNICFESMLQRVVVWQIRELAATGDSPDVMVNITNDSWFRGSTMLDHHLACNQLCTIENRRPMVIAANTGISAWIDGSGRIVEQTEKFAVGGILAEPRKDSRAGLVQRIGYPLGWLGTLFIGFSAVRRRKAAETSGENA